MRLIYAFAAFALIPAGALLADPPPASETANAIPETNVKALQIRGAQVYREVCAACHDNPEGRTPSRGYLTQTRSPDYILRALTTGVMREVTAGVSLDDKKAVATYLIGLAPGGAAEIDPNANRCSARPPAVTLAGSSWNGWGGYGVTNARYQPDPGFAATDLPRLKLKWSFAYPGGVSNEPTVASGRIFVSSMGGITYSLDAGTGCTYWSRDMGAPTRAAISLGALPSGRVAAFVTSWSGTVMALDAQTGDEIWQARADTHRATRLTGSPILYQGRLYVPVSSGEEGLAADPNYVCCSFRGSLVAFDAATGRQLWKSYTIDKAAAPIPGDSHRQGPSGAALWMAPTIDVKRGLIYVATGDDYSDPASDASDSVIAYDLKTGRKRWTSQVLAGDVFVTGCTPNRHRNCPTGDGGPDFDFGASPLIVTTPAGRDVIIAMSKGGVVFGMDPDRQGRIVWTTRIGNGGLLGGIEWGGTTDGKTIFAPISDAPYGGVRQPGSKPGLNALEPATGKLLWHVPAPMPSCSWNGNCFEAHAAAAAMMPGAIFAGSWDGHIRAFSPDAGTILWDFDTGRAFPTVNGGTAVGGSIDHGGQTIADGMLLVNSGGRQGRSGNVMLVFTVDGN